MSAADVGSEESDGRPRRETSGVVGHPAGKARPPGPRGLCLPRNARCGIRAAHASLGCARFNRVVPLKLTTVVVLGNFNPAIFQPEWFLKHDLLPRDEVEAATRAGSGPVPLIVTNNLCQVPFRSTRLQVSNERWELSTERPDWSQDLGGIVSSVFAQLRETPVRTVGFNVIEHRPPHGSPADDVIASWVPLAPLGTLVGANPRLGAKVRSDWADFRAMVQFEPSEIRPGGLFVSQNFEAAVESTAELARILGRWHDVLVRAKVVAERLSRIRE